jgi:hypothetical protein
MILTQTKSREQNAHGLLHYVKTMFGGRVELGQHRPGSDAPQGQNAKSDAHVIHGRSIAHTEAGVKLPERVKSNE